MSGFVEAIRQAKANGDPRQVLSAIPYLAFLGVQLRHDPDSDSLLSVLPPDEKLIGNPRLPALHGGVVGAFLESAALVQLIWASDNVVRLPKVITVTIDYLRPASPVETVARADITRQGRRIATLRTVAWQQDPERPVAAANAHFLLPQPPGDAGAPQDAGSPVDDGGARPG